MHNFLLLSNRQKENGFNAALLYTHTALRCILKPHFTIKHPLASRTA